MRKSTSMTSRLLERLTQGHYGPLAFTTLAASIPPWKKGK